MRLLQCVSLLLIGVLVLSRPSMAQATEPETSLAPPAAALTDPEISSRLLVMFYRRFMDLRISRFFSMN